MKLHILAVGTRMPAWVNDAFAEYVKRMPREARIELTEIKPEKRGSGRSTAQVLEVERDRILAALPAGSRRVVLDERGEQWTTVRFADALSGWLGSGSDVAFVIGGADGLHEDIKKGADRLLALSALTLPHGFARVLLGEQLYRAISIINNHPYHRE